MKEKEIKIDNTEKLDYNKIIADIMTDNVNLSDEDYAKLLNAVAENYNKLNETKGKLPTIAERRERIKSNFYGSIIGFLFRNTVLLENYIRNYAPLIEAIAEKVGVEFEKVETAEEKAMRAAAEYLEAGAEKRKAEAEKIKKQND